MQGDEGRMRELIRMEGKWWCLCVCMRAFGDVVRAVSCATTGGTHAVMMARARVCDLVVSCVVVCALAFCGMCVEVCHVACV